MAKFGLAAKPRLMSPPFAPNPKRIALIGAGIVGLACAWYLAESGADVTVFDAGEPGRGASYAAAGMLAPAFEAASASLYPRLYDFCLASAQSWPDFAARLASASGIDPGYQPGPSLALALDDASLIRLTDLAAGLEKHGQPVSWLRGAEALDCERTLSTRVTSGLVLASDGQVDNRAVVSALLVVCRDHPRVRIRGWTPVNDPLDLAEDFDAVLICAGWKSRVLSPVLVQLQPIGGQLLSVRVTGDAPTTTLRCGDLYIAPKSDRVVIGATIEPGRVCSRPDPGMIDQLQARAALLCPVLGEAERLESWSGVRPGFSDHVPVIGQIGQSRVFVATGHHRNGILLAPETAKLVTELMLGGGAPDWAGGFAPGRLNPSIMV